MVDYPVSFNSETSAEKTDENWQVKTEEGLKVDMSVPEEFGGENDNPSPEDLFSASIHTCMVATFKTIAERKNLEYDRIEGESNLSLDRGEDSRPVMKDAEINLKVYGIENASKAEKVKEAAKKNCFIHNSVKTDVRTTFEFRE